MDLVGAPHWSVRSPSSSSPPCWSCSCCPRRARTPARRPTPLFPRWPPSQQLGPQESPLAPGTTSTTRRRSSSKSSGLLHQRVSASSSSMCPRPRRPGSPPTGPAASGSWSGSHGWRSHPTRRRGRRRDLRRACTPWEQTSCTPVRKPPMGGHSAPPTASTSCPTSIRHSSRPSRPPWRSTWTDTSRSTKRAPRRHFSWPATCSRWVRVRRCARRSSSSSSIFAVWFCSARPRIRWAGAERASPSTDSGTAPS